MPAEEDPWPAPVADGPVRAKVAIPGSKSQTNRALVLAALADGPSTITGALKARDTKLMIAGLRSMGAEISAGGEEWRVEPGKLKGPAHVDCGLAGTVMRFLPVVAGLAKGDIRFDGDPRARMRPMASMLSALEALGVTIADDGRNSLPFTVRGAGRVPGGGSRWMPARRASTSAPSCSGPPGSMRASTCTTRANRCPSLPHVDMTVQMLREAGVEVTALAGGPCGRTLGRCPRADQGGRPHHRARPLQRGAVPGRCHGHRRAR